MKQDEYGWWDAPAAKFWKCPECGESSPVEEWRKVEPGCEDCGSHDGRECPRCEHWFDHVWDTGKILEGAPPDSG